MPIFVRKCVERIVLLNPDYEVELLNRISVSDYIDMSEINKEDISVTLKSDLIRLLLLQKYGGVWVDASTIMNAGLDEFLPKENSFDLIAFYCKQHYQEFKLNKYPVIENWFLATYPNSPFVEKWLDYLYPVVKLGVEPFFKTLSQRADFHIVKNNLFDEKYFLAYLAQQAMLEDSEESFDLYLRCADYSAFYYQNKFGWFNKFKYQNLLFEKSEDISFMPKIIKFTGKDRIRLDEAKELGAIFQGSFLRQFL